MNRRDLLAAERGTLHVEAETRIALVYPSPYRAAMSSLGYQQIYRTVNGLPGFRVDTIIPALALIERVLPHGITELRWSRYSLKEGAAARMLG